MSQYRPYSVVKFNKDCKVKKGWSDSVVWVGWTLIVGVVYAAAILHKLS